MRIIMNALDHASFHMYVWGVSLLPPPPRHTHTHTHKRTNEEDLWIATRGEKGKKEQKGERFIKKKWNRRSARNWG